MAQGQTAYTYRLWFDGDPASERTGTMTGNLFDMEVAIDNLDSWFHTLHFQTRDADGDWSMPISRFFLIVPDEEGSDRTIAGQLYRYWFDGDVQTEQTGTMTDNLLEMELPVDSLDDWFHTLHFQTCDADGDWSMPISKAFVIAPKLTSDKDVTGCPYRYWFDEDTTSTEGHMPGNVLELQIPVGSLADGGHVLYFQVQNREGYWSPIASGEFSVLNNTLIIRVGRGGLVAYGDREIREGEGQFSPDLGDTVTLTLSPDVCYRVDGVTANNDDVSGQLELNTTVPWGRQTLALTVDNVTHVDVSFKGHEERFTVDGLHYLVNGPDENYAILTGSDDDVQHATVPEVTSYRDSTWTLTTIDDHAFADKESLLSAEIPTTVTTTGRDLFSGSPHLAAIVWKSTLPLSADNAGELVNPNLLLYTIDPTQVPGSVINIVNLNNLKASHIVLTDAEGTGDFYCPVAFTANDITYTHNYQQQTQEYLCQGWEALTLPFDVQDIRHETQGAIYPFGALSDDDVTDGWRPFWLFAFTPDNHFVEAESIRANTPSIISMPNEAQLWDDYILKGRVTFHATNAEVQPTAEARGVESAERIFLPNYRQGEVTDALLLNVSDAFDQYAEGSVFTTGRRMAHPFEAYFLTDSGVKQFRVIDLITDGVKGVESSKLKGESSVDAVYDLAGRRVGISALNLLRSGRKGLYIANGKKVVKK